MGDIRRSWAATALLGPVVSCSGPDVAPAPTGLPAPSVTVGVVEHG